MIIEFILNIIALCIIVFIIFVFIVGLSVEIKDKDIIKILGCLFNIIIYFFIFLLVFFKMFFDINLSLLIIKWLFSEI